MANALDAQDPLVEWMETCCWDDGTTEERPFGDWWWSFRVQSGRSDRQASQTWFGKQLDRHQFTKRATSKGPHYIGPALTPAAVSAMEAAREGASLEAQARAQVAVDAMVDRLYAVGVEVEG